MALKFRVSFSPPKAADVASRKLNVVKSRDGVGESDEVIEIADPAADGYDLLVERNLHVAVRLADVDGSGNVSAWSSFTEFDALDTFPPPPPDAPVVTPLGEE